MITSSINVSLKTSCPSFELPDVITGKTISLKTFSGSKLLLVTFLARHCPYTQHIKDTLSKLRLDYSVTELGIVGICSSDTEAYPLDTPESLKDMAIEIGFNFPLCLDQTQNIAKMFRAVCTPDFYLYNDERRLVYHGQMDNSRPGSDNPATGHDLRTAIKSALAGEPINPDQKPSTGCSIKWKPGNEPEYI